MTFDEVNALTATPLETSVSVSKWMEKAGAKCKTLAGDTLRCLGRVQDLEKAFGTKMYKFVHKESGRSVHKIDAEYEFPKELEGTFGVVADLQHAITLRSSVCRQGELHLWSQLFPHAPFG